jgi:hypothetical protein
MHHAFDPMRFDGMQEILQYSGVTTYDGNTLGNVLNGLPIGLGVKEDDLFASVQ